MFKNIISARKFENYKLYILGDGRDRSKLQSQIHRLNLQKSRIIRFKPTYLYEKM